MGKDSIRAVHVVNSVKKARLLTYLLSWLEVTNISSHIYCELLRSLVAHELTRLLFA